MRFFLTVCLFLIFIMPSFAQKKTIGITTYGAFPYLSNPKLSFDGSYLSYDVLVGKFPRPNTVVKTVIRATKSNRKFEIQRGTKQGPTFTSDSKLCIFLTNADTLSILDLSSNKLYQISNVSSYDLSENLSRNWLTYKVNDQTNHLVLLNLKSLSKKILLGVNNSILADDEKYLILQKSYNVNGGFQQTIEWMNISTGDVRNIWKGQGLEGQPICDFKHKQIAFKVNDTIWYYNLKMSFPRILGTQISVKSSSGLSLGKILGFSKDGQRLQISLVEDRQLDVESKSNTVEVWSYTDPSLPSEQLLSSGHIYGLKGSINLSDSRLITLQKNRNENGFSTTSNVSLVSFKPDNGSWGTENWNRSAKECFELLNMINGNRTSLLWLNKSANPVLSPDGNFILYFDDKLNDYFCYDIKRSKSYNLTNGINKSWQTTAAKAFFNRGLAGWLKNTGKVLVYDSFDLWMLDLSGNSDPVNLTNGYGAKHDIVFNVQLEDNYWKIIPETKSLILDALNLKTKDSGFFKIDLVKNNNPKPLSMGPYIYKTYNSRVIESFGIPPIKAKYADIYIIQRMEAARSPNYFLTTDFKHFKALTDIHPESNYNWYRSELHTWTGLDGETLQGIMYKPEDFNPNRKYPIIFYYYENLSDGLNAFLVPESSSGVIDIPTYVSNGYLVFCPDISYRSGNPMRGTYSAVVSAAKYTSSFSFVNSKKMGLQGHSWGAIQTNYLISQTNIFAAACSSSGISDWFSNYGALGATGGANANMFEKGQFNMNVTPWENLSGYLNSSPLFRAESISTPLLMKHGKKDFRTPFSNALEFFLALRRLGKKVWMLVYPDAGHTVRGKDADDFTRRMMQFFDHYLKDRPTPFWMLDKSSILIDSTTKGLSLDTTGRVPGNGLLLPEEQKKIDSLGTTKSKTILLK